MNPSAAASSGIRAAVLVAATPRIRLVTLRANDGDPSAYDQAVSRQFCYGRGFLQMVPHSEDVASTLVAYVDEDGIAKRLPYNALTTRLEELGFYVEEPMLGNIVLTGSANVPGEGLVEASLPEATVATLRTWGVPVEVESEGV